MTTKSPNPVDKHVGSRVRLRRMLLGMSQEKLGQSLGVTFQQVQKYEKGTNRIGASRVQQIATILGVDIAYLYEGAPQLDSPPVPYAAGGFAEGPGADYSADFINTHEGVQIMKAFLRIKDARVRRRLVDLIEALGEAGDRSA